MWVVKCLVAYFTVDDTVFFLMMQREVTGTRTLEGTHPAHVVSDDMRFSQSMALRFKCTLCPQGNSVICSACW